MSTDWRALCAELADALDHNHQCLLDDRSLTHPLADKARAALAQPEPEVVRPTDQELADAFAEGCRDGSKAGEPPFLGGARAVLARWGRPAPAPVEGEVAELALKELERTMVLLMPVTGKNKIKRFDTIRAALKRLHELENKADLSPAPPAPKPADGEVGELVEFLRIYGDEVMDEYGDVGEHDQLTRAAELLERQAAPVPVAVNERLPGPEDLDDQRRCWWLAPETDTKCGCWCLGPGTCLPPEGFGETHWLPAHALPLPAGEVQP